MYKSHSYALFSIIFFIHFSKAITSKLQITFTKFCITGHSKSQYLRTQIGRIILIQQLSTFIDTRTQKP